VSLFHSASEQYRQSNGYNVPTNLVPFAWAGSLTGTVNQFDTSTTRVILPATSLDNPFNPKSPYYAGAQAYYGSYFSSYVGQPALFYGALTDVGSQHALYDTNVFRLAEDVTGSLGAWDLTASFGYVDSVTHVTYIDFLQPNAFYSALASGAYRVGQNAGLNPASLYAGLAPETEDTATSNLTYASLNATRNLFTLPGGPLALATGAEARRWSLANPGEPQAPQGNIQMDGSFFAFGAQDVVAAYAELSAPLVKNLELDAALRADHYFNIGNSVTPKIGAKWNAVQSLAFRGTFARGFRAPGIAEAGNAGSGSSTTPAPPDPLRCNGQPGAPNTTQDCGGPGSSVALLTRSNPNLQPEKSHSTTIGFVFEPVREFSFTADYYKIRRDGEIEPSPYVPSNAIRSPATPGSAFPGEVIGYLTPYVNESYSLVTGVDAQAKAIQDLKDWGKLTFSVDVSHMITGEQTVDGVTYHYVGTVGPTSLSGSVGTPATRANYTLDWTRGPLSLGAIYTWHSAMKGVDESVGPGCIQMSSTNPYCYVLGFGYTTVYGQYQWNANLEFTATVTDVTNRMAPLNNVTYGGQNYNASLDQVGAIGRYMEVGFRYRM
jgi:iron complex outermembrane receptor protein